MELLESAVRTPCLAWWEFRSRSAWRAMAIGSWPSYSLDMVKDVLSLTRMMNKWVWAVWLSVARRIIGNFLVELERW